MYSAAYIFCATSALVGLSRVQLGSTQICKTVTSNLEFSLLAPDTLSKSQGGAYGPWL